MSIEIYDTEDAAIIAAKNKIDCGFIDFDGNNCKDCNENSTCAGWDGESHRCDCGNRRVYWETTMTADGKFYAYASAY